MYSSLEEAFELCKISFAEHRTLPKSTRKNLACERRGISCYCVFSHDVMAAIFVCQNNETLAMFVSQTSPEGVELFCYVNAFFCFN